MDDEPGPGGTSLEYRDEAPAWRRVLLAIALLLAAVVIFGFGYIVGAGRVGFALGLRDDVGAERSSGPLFGIEIPNLVPAASEPPFSGRSWDAQAAEHRGQNGEIFSYECPPDGLFGTIWGSFIYTDDSSVCTAAVHAGAISREVGGTVRIVIRPGLPAYAGTIRNGVRSESYGRWDGSFSIVGF
jgi:hypothetical protein